jgi:hypothetical protein
MNDAPSYSAWRSPLHLRRDFAVTVDDRPREEAHERHANLRVHSISRAKPIAGPAHRCTLSGRCFRGRL